MTVQFIKTDGEGELVVLTRRSYDALLARAGVDEAEDAMADRLVLEARMARDAKGDSALPEWLSEAILAGEHPIRAARKRMGLTQVELSRRAHIVQGYLSDVESGKKRPSHVSILTLAGVLAVRPEWLED